MVAITGWGGGVYGYDESSEPLFQLLEGSDSLGSPSTPASINKPFLAPDRDASVSNHSTLLASAVSVQPGGAPQMAAAAGVTAATSTAPLTAANFKIVEGATPAAIDAFNAALTYLQRSPTAAAVLLSVIERGVKIKLDENYKDGGAYQIDDNTVTWNPFLALPLQYDGISDYWLGVQSAALVLDHEFNHAVDPNISRRREAAIDPDNQDRGEEYAVIETNKVAVELGERERLTYRSGRYYVRVTNSTQHTTGDPAERNAPDGSGRALTADRTWELQLLNGTVTVKFDGLNKIANDLIKVTGDASFEVTDATVSIASGAQVNVTLNNAIVNVAAGAKVTATLNGVVMFNGNGEGAVIKVGKDADVSIAGTNNVIAAEDGSKLALGDVLNNTLRYGANTVTLDGSQSVSVESGQISVAGNKGDVTTLSAGSSANFTGSDQTINLANDSTATVTSSGTNTVTCNGVTATVQPGSASLSCTRTGTLTNSQSPAPEPSSGNEPDPAPVSGESNSLPPFYYDENGNAVFLSPESALPPGVLVYYAGLEGVSTIYDENGWPTQAWSPPLVEVLPPPELPLSPPPVEESPPPELTLPPPPVEYSPPPVEYDENGVVMPPLDDFLPPPAFTFSPPPVDELPPPAFTLPPPPVDVSPPPVELPPPPAFTLAPPDDYLPPPEFNFPPPPDFTFPPVDSPPPFTFSPPPPYLPPAFTFSPPPFYDSPPPAFTFSPPPFYSPPAFTFSPPPFDFSPPPAFDFSPPPFYSPPSFDFSPPPAFTFSPSFYS